MENSTTLFRILDHVSLNCMVLSNLYNDDRFFKNKILYTYMPFYSAEEQVLLDNICTEANYKLVCLSRIPKTNVQNFIQFFANGKHYPSIDAVVPFMNAFELGDNEALIYRRLSIIVLMKMLFDCNFVMICNYDRFILPEQKSYPCTRSRLRNRDHIADLLLTGKFENTNELIIKSKADLNWICNTSTTSLYNKSGYTFKYFFPSPNYELGNLIKNTNVVEMDNYNHSILSIDSIMDAYNVNNPCPTTRTWQEVEITLLTGKLIPKISIKNLTYTTRSDFRYLNFYKNKLEHEIYKQQYENFIKLYNTQFTEPYKSNALYNECVARNLV